MLAPVRFRLALAAEDLEDVAIAGKTELNFAHALAVKDQGPEDLHVLNFEITGFQPPFSCRQGHFDKAGSRKDDGLLDPVVTQERQQLMIELHGPDRHFRARIVAEQRMIRREAYKISAFLAWGDPMLLSLPGIVRQGRGVRLLPEEPVFIDARTGDQGTCQHCAHRVLVFGIITVESVKGTSLDAGLAQNVVHIALQHRPWPDRKST